MNIQEYISLFNYRNTGFSDTSEQVKKTDNYTLEDLLNDEDIIQELRNLNPKVLKL